MRAFTLITPTQRVTFKFPTSIDDIMRKYLVDVTSHISIADNHTLVGLIYHDKLGNIILARKQAKKSFSAGVVPVFVKCGKSEEGFLEGINVRDKLIISSSDLATGHHIVCTNNSLSLDTFINFLDKDTTIAQRYHNNYGSGECYFVEFKLVPNCDIKGFYKSSPALTNNRYLTMSDLYHIDDSNDSDDFSGSDDSNNSTYNNSSDSGDFNDSSSDSL